MYDAFPSLYEVRTLADVRARAEFLAWTTADAYRAAGQHAHGRTRSDRAASFRKAREYQRRAIRASQHANRRQPSCRGGTTCPC